MLQQEKAKLGTDLSEVLSRVSTLEVSVMGSSISEASTQAICVGNRGERRILECKKMSKVRNFNIYTLFCVKKKMKVAMDKPCSVKGG
jgi:hypothetical protein